MNRIRLLFAAVALALLVAACGTVRPTPSLRIVSSALPIGVIDRSHDFTFAVTGIPDGIDAVTFSWEFGDGTTGRVDAPVDNGSALTVVAHTYTDIGEYDVTASISAARQGEITSRSASLTILSDRRFEAPRSLDTGRTTHSVAMVDLDGDGHLDVVATASHDARVAILWGQGDRQFSDGPRLVTDAGLPKHAAAGDFNGDGCMDLAVAIERGNLNQGVAVFLGDGPDCRSFSEATYFEACEATVGPALTTSTHQVAIGDLNGDGHLDLVAACWETPNVAILEGDGNGEFAAPERIPTPIDGPTGDNDLHAVVIADLNGDGHDDIAIAALGRSEALVFISQGDFDFDEPAGYGTGLSPHGITVHDVNGDGHLDLVTANQSGNNVSVLLNRGDGTFEPSEDYDVGLGATPKDVAIGDLNGDGLPDIVVANSYGNQPREGVGLVDTDLSILYGTGDGEFAAAQTLPLDLTPFDIEILDIDGDGLLDLAVANWDSDDVKILYNSGVPAAFETGVVPR